jgi:hypothetical protein
MNAGTFGSMEKVRSHYPVRFRLGGVERRMIWYGDETDGVLLFGSDRIAVFTSRSELEQYAEEQGFRLEAEVDTVYDFDVLSRWLPQATPETVDCEFLLNMWNMLCDIANSLGDPLQEPDAAMCIYDKLFRGCNLPSMTPHGEHFEPSWSVDEIGVMSDVLWRGLSVSRRAVGHAA